MAATIIPNWGKKIREIREAKGVSLIGLAKKVGTSKYILTQVELHNREVSLELVWKISHALEVDIMDIVLDKPVTVENSSNGQTDYSKFGEQYIAYS